MPRTARPSIVTWACPFSRRTHTSAIVRFKEHRPEIGTDQIGDANGVVVLTPSVTAATVANARDLLAIGRFGVGYDAVNVAACTEADVVVFITAGAVDHSVAEATVGWMIALTHHMRIKDKLVRDGQWDQRSHYMGRELRDRTFGAIGLGGIARKTIALLKGFGMKQPLAFDPYVAAKTGGEIDGVRYVPRRVVEQSRLRFPTLSAHRPNPRPDRSP